MLIAIQFNMPVKVIGEDGVADIKLVGSLVEDFEEKIGKHKTAWQMVTVSYFLLLLSLMEFQRAGIDLHAKEWWWPVWRYGGWTLAGVALALTLYSGLGYLWRHRDLIAEE